MTYTVIYDLNGNLQGAQRSDGASIPAAPGNRDWDEFVALNGAPPLTGAPSYKAAKVPKQIHAVFQAIIALNLNAAQNGQFLAAIAAFLLVKGSNFSGDDLFAYLQQEFPAITFPSGSQLAP